MTAIRKRGPEPSIDISEIRSLTRDELSQLAAPRALPVTKRFRDPHHRLARLLASGLKPEEAGARAGYSLGSVWSLNRDPAFQNLIAHYRGLVTDAFVDGQDEYYEMATANMVKAERQIAEHLEAADEANEPLPLRELRGITSERAQFRYAKQNQNVNINADFAAMLEKAIDRSASARLVESTSSRTPGAVQAESSPTPRSVSGPPRPFLRRA